jgi:hypothetical protein
MLMQTKSSSSHASSADGPELSPSTRARWDEAVARELQTPGFVDLVPVVVNGTVLDFCCADATPRGAALLGSLDGDVDGLTLTEIVGSWQRALELIRAYRQVYQGGIEFAFWCEAVPTCAGPVLHRAVRTADGLRVTLTCPDQGDTGHTGHAPLDGGGPR